MEIFEAWGKAIFSSPSMLLALLSPWAISSTPRSSLISYIDPWSRPLLWVSKSQYVQLSIGLFSLVVSDPLNSILSQLMSEPCPTHVLLSRWPDHSCMWRSQQLSGFLHSQSNVSPQHLSSIWPHTDCTHLAVPTTSLLLHNLPFSLQPSIKKLLSIHITPSPTWEPWDPLL